MQCLQHRPGFYNENAAAPDCFVGLHSGDSGTRAEPELQNDAEATPALELLRLSLSYKMMEGLLLFKF